MAKPTEDITWATDATFTADGDAWGGSANKADPGATRRAEGAEPDTFPAEWFNYHLNAQGQHIEYIHDVLEATDSIPSVSRTIFVPPSAFSLGTSRDDAKRYLTLYPYHQFTASAQTHTIPIDLPVGAVVTAVDWLVDTSGTGVVVGRLNYTNSNFAASPSLVSNNIATANTSGSIGTKTFTDSSVVVHRVLKKTQNHYLEITSGNSADEWIGARVEYEVVDAPASAYSSAQSTTGSLISLNSQSEHSTLGETSEDVAVVALNRFIPHGAVISDIRALVQPGAARAGLNRMTLTAYTNATRDVDTVALGSAGVAGTASDDTTANLQKIELTSLGYTVDSDDQIFVRVAGGIGDAEPDSFYGVEIEFTDPGPRNF